MTEQSSPREIVADHADQSITRAASFAAEGARIVCHVQLGSVPTIYAVIAEFYTAAYAIETAVDNMSRDLTRLASDGDLYDTRPDGDPLAAIDTAKGALARAAARAEQLGRALQDAQNAIAGVGHSRVTSRVAQPNMHVVLFCHEVRETSPDPNTLGDTMNTDIRAAITAAEARCKILETAQNTFALGDTVRSTLPEFAGTMWSEPMTVEKIVPNHPLHKPVLVRTADGGLGAFSPADLELVR